MPASGRLHSTLDRPCVRRQAGRGPILGDPTASRSSDRCPRSCSGPTARTPPEPLPLGHEPIVRAAMQGEVVGRVRAAVRPRDPVMELHCVARPAHVTALAHEGAAPVVPIVDLAPHFGGDVFSFARRTRPRLHGHGLGHDRLRHLGRQRLDLRDWHRRRGFRRDRQHFRAPLGLLPSDNELGAPKRRFSSASSSISSPRRSTRAGSRPVGP